MNFETGEAGGLQNEAPEILKIAQVEDWSAALSPAPPPFVDSSKGDVGLSRSDQALTVTNLKWLSQTRTLGDAEKRALFPNFKAGFKQAIEYADQDHTAIESAMETTLPGFRSEKDALNAMKGVSEALRTMPPQSRKAMIKVLSEPEAADSFMQLEPGDNLNIVTAFDLMKTSIAGLTDKHPAEVAKAWFNYHESTGDRIGSRQVYAGLLEKYGNTTDDAITVNAINNEIEAIKAAHGGDYTK